ncbi:MAG: hypothetical protein AB7E42_08345 [Anaerotignaceae bacterium]
MKQKWISFILVGVLSFSCCNSAFAAQKVSDSMFYTQDLEMNKIELSESEMMQYSIYDIDFSKEKLTRSISNEKITNDEVTNDEATNDEATNDEITNDEITNDEATNDEITNDEVTNDEATDEDVT